MGGRVYTPPTPCRDASSLHGATPSVKGSISEAVRQPFDIGLTASEIVHFTEGGQAGRESEKRAHKAEELHSLHGHAPHG